MNALESYRWYRKDAKTLEQKHYYRRIFFRFAKETLTERELSSDPARQISKVRTIIESDIDLQTATPDEIEEYLSVVQDACPISNKRFIPYWHSQPDNIITQLYRLTNPRNHHK